MPRQKATAATAADTTTATTTKQDVTEATETTEKTPATSRKKGTPVSSAEIKRIMSENEGSPIDVIAQKCGFYTEITNNATGEVEIRVTAADQREWMRCSLEAQSGIKLAPPVQPYRRTNRSPVVKIGKTGNIVVGGRHTSIAGFPYGEGIDSYVKIEAEPGRIVITAGVKEADEAEPELDDIDSSDLDTDDDRIEY